MTWEWVTLIGTVIVCGSVLAGAWLYLPQRLDQEVNKKLSSVFDDIRTMNTRIKVLEENQVTMLKVADETKKMLSQANLASSLGTMGLGVRAR